MSNIIAKIGTLISSQSVYPSANTVIQHIQNISGMGSSATETVTTWSDAAFSATANKWHGGLLGVDNMIYGLPYQTNYLLKINPSNLTASRLTFSKELFGVYHGGSAAANGNIYIMPQSPTAGYNIGIVEFNPRAGTAKSFGNFTSTSLFQGGTFSPYNNCIYSAPMRTNAVYKINTQTLGISSLGSVPGTVDQWASGVLGSDGMIYHCPLNQSTILKINPLDDTVTTLGSFNGKYYSAVLAQNSNIYFIPYSGTGQSVVCFNTTTQSLSTFGSFSGTNMWMGGVLAPNGMIYGIPYNATYILKIDPISGTATTFGEYYAGTGKWCGGVLWEDTIFCIPEDASTVLKIKTNSNAYFNPNIERTPYLNRTI